MFRLDERLDRDTAPVAALPLCRVLLMDNRLWPWLILVPEREGAREFIDLTEADSAQAMREIRSVSTVLRDLFQPDKINVGALGNVVPQLHIHVLCRYRNDPAWPGPVWGSGHAERYEPDARAAMAERIRDALRL